MLYGLFAFVAIIAGFFCLVFIAQLILTIFSKTTPLANVIGWLLEGELMLLTASR